MHIKYILVVLVPLVLSIGTIPALPFDLIQEADAKKSVVKKKHGELIIRSFSIKNTILACDDRICKVLPSDNATTKVEPIIKLSPYLQKILLFLEESKTGQETGKFSPPINLSGQNLYGKTLNHLDLRYADLSYTNLRGVDLEGVDLTGANLQSSFLYNANLDGAILKDANLSNAKLLRAYLRDADLSNANLSNVNFHLADLTSANLTNANLQNTNLFRANFASVDLYNADMTGAGTTTTNFNDCMNHPVCNWTNYHTKMNS